MKPLKVATPGGAARAVGGIVQFGEEVTVSSGTMVEGSVVVVGGGARIFGTVEEDVVVMGGPLLIDSEVKGSVFVFGRSASLGPHAVIDGDLTTLGAKLTQSGEAVVRGEKVAFQGVKVGVIGALAALMAFIAALLFWLKVLASLGWAILAALLAALFPGPLEDSAEYLSERPLWSLAGGVLLLPAALLISAALAVSLVGFALLPLVLVALAALGVWGYLTIGFWIGDRLFRGARLYMQAWLSCLLGVAIMQIVRWVPVAGNWITGLALVFGVGAALLTFLNACVRWRMKPVPIA